MGIRPLTEAERKYAFKQSTQLQGQTGSIGILRGEYGADKGFRTEFHGLNDRRKADGFEAGLQETLCSGGAGFLQDLDTMREYVSQHPQNGLPGSGGAEYGFRLDTEKHAYLIRCGPVKGNGSVEVHCYVKEWPDSHIREAEKGIRFIDSRYKELFRIADGGKIMVTDAMGGKTERVCRYIDEYHTEVGNSLYHICQFAEAMERSGSGYAPAEEGLCQKRGRKEKSR